MKRLVLGLLVVASTLQGFSKEINIEEAKLVSESFFKATSKADLIVEEAVVFQSNKVPLTYVVNFKPEGWALVSADDRAPAILGYSSKGHFDTKEVKSLPFYFWFKGYADQISALILSNTPEIVHPSWTEIKTSKYTKTVEAVEPLIQVLWNQGAGWNKFCPADVNGPGGHAYAGCVAVAMAQCMSVYQHPTQGYSSHSYNHETYGTQYANFGETTYDWANMENEGATDAVALLLYHLGVSVNMGYAADGSGAMSSSVPGAIKSYFDYSNSAQFISRADYPTEGEWEGILIDQLSKGHPIYYSGDGGDGEAGHAFNIDGVNSNGAFHFNFGWSGSYNGYYFVTSIAPGSYNFTFNQDAVINFMPRDNTPQDISLSNSTVEEGMPTGTVVGKIIVTDETPDDTFTYDISGPIGFDGEQVSVPFAEQEGNLVTTQALDYNYISRYEIIIKATDKTGLSVEKNVFVNIDPNSAPTNINIINSAIYDTTTIGSYIAKLSTVDKDEGDTFTYTFENNENSDLSKDNNKFTISNDSLYSNYDFNNYSNTECNIYIKSKDKKGESVAKVFTLTINKTTGLVYSNLESDIQLYPNPTTDYITISGATENNYIKSIYLYNTVGNLCKVIDVNEKEINIDLSDYHSGVYFMKIKLMNGAHKTIKVIKKN